ncbi:sce7725 family protein [Cellulomonas endometrii]|uniref:sce7725 family protein n=1 Tax=Cellulomonas endometrii TaxID=3036301 RepID=UPI0024AE766A|nr:sce7725 family protein [Cellulomonas endometrii]
MYFPYLFARQQELLALRALAGELTGWDIVPVLEPASVEPKDLARCLQELATHDAACYLVVNPSVHRFPDPAPRWSAAIAPYLAPHGPVYPVHQISNPQDVPALAGFLASHGGGRTAVSLRSALISPRALAAAVSALDSIVFVHEGVNHTAYLDALPTAQGVLVGHRLNVQARNADYAGDEWFTDANRAYLAERRPGYSDCGPLAPDFSERGGPASAVAIHLTYVSDGDIWVEHFVSDSVTLNDGDNTSKLAEATAKVAARVAAEPTKFVRSAGLDMFLRQHAAQKPTNLPTSKRQQLMHHLHTAAAARPGSAAVSIAPTVP